MFEDMICVYNMCVRGQSVKENCVTDRVQKEPQDDDEVIRERKAWNERSEVNILSLYTSISFLLCTNVAQPT